MHNLNIETYIKEAETIEKMYMDLLEGTTQKRMKRIDDGSTGLQNVEYRVCVINSKNQPLQRALLQRYEDWYEGCRGLVQEYAGTGRNAKYEEFTGLHEKIVSLINLKDSSTNSNEKKDLRKEFISCFDAQVNVLRAIEPMVASAKDNYNRMFTADLLNSELAEAETLYEQGFIRPAGIVAGVALERYLKTLCEVNGIESEPEDTIGTMAQRLLESNKLHYFDSEMLESLDHLATLKDKCTDPDEEPHEHEIRELLDGVREIMFMALF